MEGGVGTAFRGEGAGTAFMEGGVGTAFRGEGAGTASRGEGVGAAFRGLPSVCFGSKLSTAACIVVSSRILVRSECIVGPCACLVFLLGRLLAAVGCGLAFAAPERVARRALVSTPVGCWAGRDSRVRDVTCLHEPKILTGGNTEADGRIKPSESCSA